MTEEQRQRLAKLGDACIEVVAWATPEMTDSQETKDLLSDLQIQAAYTLEHITTLLTRRTTVL